ncbi:MAG: hypothetical protein Q9209_001297 [Squamulea sp. 1 TL-2023]
MKFGLTTSSIALQSQGTSSKHPSEDDHHQEPTTGWYKPSTIGTSQDPEPDPLDCHVLSEQSAFGPRWACNVKGVKIPWEIVANEMGSTITAGAVIQHLAKFRARMVEQKLDVPPALTRGGNNQAAAAAKAGQGNGSNKSATSRRNNKRKAKKSKANEDSEDDTPEDMDGDSEPEVSAKASKRAKGNMKAKGPACGRNAAKLTNESDDDLSDAVKDEASSSTDQGEDIQARYGVGDAMWDMGAGSSTPSKVVVFNVDPQDLARLEPKDDGSSCQSETSGHSSENHYGGDYSPMIQTSSDGAAPPTKPEELRDPLGADADFENMIGPGRIYHLETNHGLPGFDGSLTVLSHDTQQNSHGDENPTLHGLPSNSSFAGAAYHSFDPSPSAKLNDQVSNHGGPSESGYQFRSDLAQHVAYPSYTGFLDSSSPNYTGSHGISADRPGNPIVGHQISGYDTSALYPSQLTAQTRTVDRQQCSYSSMDSYHPIGGEFVNHPSVSLANFSETPVAMSRDTSGFGYMSSNPHQQPDTNISWGTFFDANDHGFDY